MMRILVTGHDGFVGRALCDALRADGIDPTGVSLSTGHDLTQMGALDGIRAVDRIVHLAGFVGVPPAWNHPEKCFRMNLLGTLTVLEFARRDRTPVLFLSSYIYGPPERLPIDESHPARPSNPYARSKHLAEGLCAAYAADFGVPVTILRPFNLYGPGQDPDALIPSILRQARAGGVIELKDPAPKRDHLWIGDLVDALCKVLRAEPETFGVYNVGSGSSLSVQELVETFFSASGVRLPVRYTEDRRPAEIPDCRTDARSFRTRFSWAPATGLAEGLRAMWERT